MFDLSTVGAGLSLARDIDRLPALLQHSPTLVVQAPPGTGKTTLVPPAVSNAVSNALSNADPQEQPGKVLVVAPRRVAVRAAAARLRALTGPKHQGEIGYSIRGSHEPGSKIEFLTPGVLLNRLLRTPELPGVAAVIVDEVHERGLETDLLLGMLRELVVLRDDLFLIAMSATLDATKFCDYLGAPLLATESVLHPVEVRYEPVAGRLTGTREFYAELGRIAVRELTHTQNSVLVFVPGVREIELVLASCAQAPVFALHGRLDVAAQDAALYSPGPRIIVSTPVAESSVTVPGVRVVIDSGLARVPRRDRARGMTGLVTESISKSSAEQRAGRAGREGPGIVIRAYSATEFAAFRAATLPEISSADLTSAVLTMQAWGSPDLELLDPPTPQALHEAQETLLELGSPGPELATLPLPPRLGHALLSAGAGAAATIAVLSDSPSGNVAQLRASTSEVRRLARLAPESPPQAAGWVTALAYPRWVARRLDDAYQLASGTRARLAFPLDSEWIACAEVQRTRDGAIIRAAAPLTEAEALTIVPPTTAVEAAVVDGQVRGRKVTRAGAIILSSTPVQLAADDVREALLTAVSNGLELRWTEDATALRHRLAFIHAQLGAPWPDMSWESLAARAELWLSGSEVTVQDLQKLLPWPEATHLDDLAPARLRVPSGNTHRLLYDDGRPVCRVKLQECFGLAQSPEFCGVTVQFHLLSPAGRPLAITDDLASFWSGPYAGVRADMRGRYPKHPWPEDPWSATATAGTRRRG
ncbi:ATP-dependent RNA helicase [Corynebacterium epidermidicanis]|uniref:HrpA-like helicase n=1 Tax=Corynebacterium epidermidicanis TaxID=1050174 RepID=A0A0G3GT70_9CORY|nr:ATP-dependent helicase C-terminal domain-containing protein [Corynebacterium epidermidicanis]AKK02057.1 HrpA-like helicase [Corynebacterium epidermidicanis]